MRHGGRLLMLGACCVAVLGVSGCESWQRKFTRRPKEASRPPSPVISFQDYSGAMTPLERYRKHAIMFDYWNQDLIDSLQVRSPNPKRYRRASEEALGELKTMQALLNDETAAGLGAVIDARVKLNRQAQSQEFSDQAQASLIIREVERQAREIHRSFYWRDVQEQLKAPQPKAPDAAVH